VLRKPWSRACSQGAMHVDVGAVCKIKLPTLMLGMLPTSLMPFVFLQRSNLLALTNKTKIPLVQLLDEWDLVSPCRLTRP
jgi:hypothetical protein